MYIFVTSLILVNVIVSNGCSARDMFYLSKVSP